MFEREVREMAFTPRWSIVRTNRQQYLAEHSYFVILYANDLAIIFDLDAVDTAMLLQMAIWHDMEEIFSGDLPGPCKRAAMDEGARRTWDAKLKVWLMKLFASFNIRSGNKWFRDAEQVDMLEKLLKLADMIDECCEMGTELQMGNRTVHRVFDDSLNRVMKAVDAVIEFLPDGVNPHGFRDTVRTACLRSRDAESRNTRIFETL